MKCVRILCSRLQTASGQVVLAPRVASGDAFRHYSNNNSSQTQWRPHLVILDKNGTLINMHATWGAWVQAMTKRLEVSTGLPLAEKLYRRLSVCLFTGHIRSGLVADGTTWQIRRAVEDVLYEEGLSLRQAQTVLERNWKDCETSDPATLQTFGDLKGMLRALKEEGTKLVVCTSDLRRSTEKTLRKLGLRSYLDKVVCCDDDESDLRPSKRTIQQICRDLDVSPKDAVVIGDTPGDVIMGKGADVALSVGVLSGTGTRLELSPHADIVARDLKDALTRIKQLSPRDLERFREKRSAKESSHKVSLVIFDKDGTLLDFNSFWTPWIKSLFARLEEVTGLSLQSRLLSELGYCSRSLRWRPGLFAEGTSQQNRERIREVLEEEGLSRAQAESMVADVWQHHATSLATADARPLDNPAVLFRILQRAGVKVAVCTADCRRATQAFLDATGSSQYVDYLVCGDDPDSVPKPSGHNAIRICEALGVPAWEAVMVGDTQADLGMGREAGLGATVAVLSGVGDVDDLKEGSDHVVPSIKHVLEVVLSGTEWPRKTEDDVVLPPSASAGQCRA